MDKTEQDQWLSKDIPHRLRACLAGLRLQEERMLQIADEAKRLIIRDWFLRPAAFEGRMVAMRWLIEFIGVGGRNKDGTISPPRRKPNDVSIKMIEGGKEIELDSREAEILAKVRQACTQASGHATRNTNHPRVDESALDEALRIIVRHLECTVYLGRARDPLSEAFNPQ